MSANSRRARPFFPLTHLSDPHSTQVPASELCGLAAMLRDERSKLLRQFDESVEAFALKFTKMIDSFQGSVDRRLEEQLHRLEPTPADEDRKFKVIFLYTRYRSG